MTHDPKTHDKVVLAYSGGLDTSVAVKWLGENYGCSVIAVSADVGQTADFEAVRARALLAGATHCEVLDLKDEFASGYCLPALRSNALYEGRYPLVSALSRPVIAEHLVAEARKHGATAVAHGCTGKGNDQVRFEVSVRALAPDLDVLAPVRTWGFTREDSVEYAERHGIPVDATRTRIYSVDDNLWGRAVECGALEDPWAAPPEDVWEMTRPVSSPPRDLVVSFEAGVPVAVDGVPMTPARLIHHMNDVVGGFGWGRLDMVENRRVGIKSREVYEAPGALALIKAHQELESITLERDLAREKARLEIRWAELAYDGLWHSPLRSALDAFVRESQQHVTGDVRLHLSPGQCVATGRRSATALYDYGLATYDAEDAFRHEDSAGFVRLWGLSLETWAQRQAAKSLAYPAGKASAASPATEEASATVPGPHPDQVAELTGLEA